MTALLANMGIPMLAVVWPASVVLFLPIAFIEALIARTVLKIGFRKAGVLAVVVNGVSTLLAIPFTWVLILALQGTGSHQYEPSLIGRLSYAFRHSAWLAPFGETEALLVPLALMFLCIPFFFASVATEYMTARFFFGKDEPNGVGRWAWIANGVTYAGILIMLAIIGWVRAAR